MNIINKAAFKSLKKNHTRTVVTVIGVILSSAMLTAVITFGISLLDYVAKGAAQKYGDWHGAFWDVDASFAKERMSDEEVIGGAVFENIGWAMLEGGKTPHKPYLFLAGFSQETFDILPLTLISGRLPENSSEVLVSTKIEKEGGVSYSIGDTLSLLVGERMKGNEELGACTPYTEDELLVPRGEKTYKVVGICGTPGFENDSLPGYTLITRSTRENPADDLSLFLTLKEPYGIRAYMDDKAGGHGYILNNNVLRFMGLSDNPSDRVFLAFLYSVGVIVVMIIMTGSVFLIYNSFSISLSERIRQVGIFASVGATAKQLRNSVLFEGLCIGAMGIPIGILAGLGGMEALISLVARNFESVFYEGVSLTMKVSAPALVGAIAVSLMTILISAYIPAKKAAGTPVMECIRQTNEVKLEGKRVRISRRIYRLWGLEGVLAMKNFKRNRKRYRSIILSLVLSIVLFISTSALVEDLQKAAGGRKEFYDCDIGFSAQAMGDGEMLGLYDKMKEARGVSEGFYQAYMESTGIVQGDSLSEDYWKMTGGMRDGTAELYVGVRFFEDSFYGKMVEDLGLPVGEYMGENGKAIAVAQLQDNPRRQEGDPINDMFLDSSGEVALAPKDPSGPGKGWEKEIRVTFAEFVPPDTPPVMGDAEQGSYIFWVMLPWSAKDEFAPADTEEDREMLKGMSFQSEDPAGSAADMRSVIRNTGVTAEYLLLNMSEMLDENRNMIFIANVFAYTFIVIISLIAVVNVFNTISTNIKLRRRELAMLRSVGMSDRSFDKMMGFECVCYGVKALLYGLPIAAAASWLIHLNMVTEDVKFTLPWRSMGISIVTVLLVVFITMMYAVSKIKKENIMDALRDEMT